jgi:hypothetical protein
LLLFQYILSTLGIDTGSNALISDTHNSNNFSITSKLGASLISSVFGLKESHHIQIVFHFISGIFCNNLSTTFVFCNLFTSSVDVIILKLKSYSLPVSINACTSLGKQLHPYQIPACKNL